MDREKILTKAKFDLMTPPTARTAGNPIFYSSILFTLRQFWSDETRTAGVDGRNLFICEPWFCGLTLRQRVGLLAHEVLHIALRHIDYFHIYNLKVFTPLIEHKLWNYAGDHVINLMLLAAGYELPPNGLWDSRFKGMSTFEVYRILHDEYQQDASMLDGYEGDITYLPLPKNTEEERELNRLQKDITVVVASAKISAELAKENIGSELGEVLRLLDAITNPKLAFEVILANYMNNLYAKDDYSYRRPNRRYMPELYLPTLFSESLEDIVATFDLSRSVTDKTLSSFRNGIRMIKEQFNPKRMTLISWDTAIRDVQEITDGTNIMQLEFTGGGGTNAQPVIDWIKENQPMVTLIFTDGKFYEPDFTGVSTDIIWLIEGNPSWVAPYGRVFHYTLEEHER